MNVLAGRIGLMTRIAGSGVMLFFVARSLNIREVVGVLTHQTELLFFFSALSLFVAAQSLAVVKWHLIGTRVFGVFASFFTYTQLFFAGIFYMIFLPGGQLIGEGMKAYRMVGSSFSPHKVFASQFLDRVTGFIALGILTSCAFFLSSTVSNDPPSLLLLLSILAITGVGVGVLYMPVRLVRMFERYSSFSKVLEDIRRGRKTLAVSIVPGLLSHLLSIFATMSVLRALGVMPTFWLVAWMYLIMGIGIALPISYAGLGVREGAFAYYLGLMHVSQEVAVSAAVLLFFIQLANACLGGVCELYALWRK